MDIKTVPLSWLETNLQAALVSARIRAKRSLSRCPTNDWSLFRHSRRRKTIRWSMISLQSNPEFRTLVAKSKAGPRKPFPAQAVGNCLGDLFESSQLLTQQGRERRMDSVVKPRPSLPKLRHPNDYRPFLGGFLCRPPFPNCIIAAFATLRGLVVNW